MRVITDAEVAQLVNMREAIHAMGAAFEQFGNGVGSIAPRVRATSQYKGSATTLSVLGAALPASGVLGAKVYATVDGRFNFVIVLFSARTGAALAAIEANEITRLRTAAASAVALQHLARRDASVLTLFGTGVQARAHAEAFLLTWPFKEVLVASGSDASGLAQSVATEFGVHARTAEVAEAVGAADVICTCTRATEPLFDGSLVKPGTLIAAIGASKPQARELDDTLLQRADLIVVEWLTAAQAEAGELVRAAPGILDATRVVELGKLLVHGTAYTRRPGDIVIYKSVGIGLEDVALANLVWQRAG
jgi:ornithine cyclodeaminase